MDKPTYEELEQRVKELEKEAVERKEDALKDSTRLKQSEETLRASEEKADAMLSSIGDHMSMMDKGLTIIWANKIATKLFGNDIIGKKCFEAYHQRKEPCEPYPCLTLKAFQDGKVHEHDTEVIDKSGETIYFHCTANVALRDKEGNPVAVIEISRDVTDSKRAEAALKSSEAEKSAILDATTELIVYHDTNLKIIWANRAAAKSVGLTTEQLVGRYCHEMWCQLNKPLADCPAVKVIETGQPHEVELSSCDGKFWIHKGYPVRNNKDGIEGVVTTALDITEHKQAGEKRKKLEAQLQKAQKMEAIGTLAGGIAHDFNNLLMGIQGYASLTLMHMDSNHPNFEYVKGIGDMVQRGATLTKQLLGFAGRGKYEVKPTDLNDVIDNSSEMFGQTKKEIRIHRKYQKHIWTVEVDKGQIEQVLLNLYVNAWQAMSYGGELYLETSYVVIDDTSATAFGVKPGKFVLLTVTDTGAGNKILQKQSG